jgi:hypothetical protein
MSATTAPTHASLRQIADWQLNPEINSTITVDLPRLQRGFVWEPSKIMDLWDSILRGFPIGSLLLSTHGELIRCALLWLQRKYLSDQFPDYDPTSIRDEDLPIDLDHLIPHHKFGVDWRRQQTCLSFQSPDEKENFHHLRWTVGNSLGNFRWLNASDNRGRQDGQIAETDRERDFIDDIPRWNDLIEKNVWTEKDVAAFQELIDLRSIKIYETLLCNGLNAFVSVAPHSKDKL